MWELSGEPSRASSQCVRCQFGLFLCTGPMVVFEVHVLVHVTTMSLLVSLLERAKIPREDLSPANRVAYFTQTVWELTLPSSAAFKVWLLEIFGNNQGLQEGCRLQQASIQNAPAIWDVVNGSRRQKISSMSWTTYRAQKRSQPNAFPYGLDQSTSGDSSPEECSCESVCTTVLGAQVSPCVVHTYSTALEKPLNSCI